MELLMSQCPGYCFPNIFLNRYKTETITKCFEMSSGVNVIALMYCVMSEYIITTGFTGYQWVWYDSIIFDLVDNCFKIANACTSLTMWLQNDFTSTIHCGLKLLFNYGHVKLDHPYSTLGQFMLTPLYLNSLPGLAIAIGYKSGRTSYEC